MLRPNWRWFWKSDDQAGKARQYITRGPPLLFVRRWRWWWKSDDEGNPAKATAIPAYPGATTLQGGLKTTMMPVADDATISGGLTSTVRETGPGSSGIRKVF